MVDYIIYMEEIVYSNVQAKSCSGSCTYTCNGSTFTNPSDDCSPGCSCDMGDPWTESCNGGECIGPELTCTVPCV